MAGGRAFTFRYAETEELLTAAGCDVVHFDPLTDPDLPPRTAGIYLGGGFPEVHAPSLSDNASLRTAIACAVADGVPTVAECAGLLYLCQSLDGLPMVGALPADAAMTPKLTLAYRTVKTHSDTLLGRVGEQVTGHEFHRTAVTPSAGATTAWLTADTAEGHASDTVHASYLHTHWAGHPQLAARFAEAARLHTTTGLRQSHSSAHRHRVSGKHSSSVETDQAPAADGDGFDTDSSSPLPNRTASLRHHGDVEATEGLIDLAVNVVTDERPGWLQQALLASLDDARAYPDARPAEAALAGYHGVDIGNVLATAGAAEAFTLIARARAWQHPVVVHPQFTEPDVALLAAGHTPHHVTCRAEDSFALDVGDVPDRADLVVIGNPTNPTGALHPAATVRALLRPGRLVVVDEAFMDTIPGETDSLAGQGIPGLLVVRSLTKHWGIPGIRAGYVLGDPETIEQLRDLQTPWSVSTAAIAAMVACTTETARAEAARRAERIVANRHVLEAGLSELGIPHQPSAASFVLARPGAGFHGQLRTQGFAVRRADTFPGLDDRWVRIAVRDPGTTRLLLAALAKAPASASHNVLQLGRASDHCEGHPAQRPAARSRQ